MIRVGELYKDMTCAENGLVNVLQEARKARDEVLGDMMDTTILYDGATTWHASVLFVLPRQLCPRPLPSSTTHLSLPLPGSKVLTAAHGTRRLLDVSWPRVHRSMI